MDNIVFLMTKTPIQGIIKTRLAKSLGNCSVKRFTLQNIENIKKNLINIKNLNFSYIQPQKKNLEVSLLISLKILFFKRVSI